MIDAAVFCAVTNCKATSSLFMFMRQALAPGLYARVNTQTKEDAPSPPTKAVERWPYQISESDLPESIPQSRDGEKRHGPGHQHKGR